MKLRISESEQTIIYVDFIKDDMSDFQLDEDQVFPDEPILNADEYNDLLDTRNSIAEYLGGLSMRIEVYPYVDRSYVYTSKADSGLSNYVRIIFDHPSGLSEEEIIEHYRYSIRFSDHKHEEAKQDVKILDSVEVVGMKPKNFEKAGIKVFNSCVSDVQRAIAKFEISNFGKQITFF